MTVTSELASPGLNPVPLMISSIVAPLRRLTTSNTMRSSESRSLFKESVFLGNAPISLIMSSIMISGTAPSLIRRLQPMLVWLFIFPGTAYTVRPCSDAHFAVISDPLLRPASTTTRASESPLIILFLAGKLLLKPSASGGYSLTTRPPLSRPLIIRPRFR